MSDAKPIGNMPQTYSINADGRAYWYSDPWGSLMFDWDPLAAASGDASKTERVLLQAMPAQGRSTGWYRLFLPQSRRLMACQRIKHWLDTQNKKVVIQPYCLGGGSHGGWVYSDIFGSLRFFSELGSDTDGTPASSLDTKPQKECSTGIYQWAVPKSRRDAAIRQIVEYAQALGVRVHLE